MLLFQLAEELGLQVADLQAWLLQQGHPDHADPLARLDRRSVAAARQAFAKPPAPPNLAVRGFRVDGFKAFGSPQHVPLAPITLVFGPNSSGKSSLLHSLLWANHAAITGELDVVRPALAGDSVNLGGFNLVRFRRTASALGFSFDLADGTGSERRALPRDLRLHLSFTRGFESTDDELDALMDALRSEKVEELSNPRLGRFSLEAGGRELLRLSQRKGTLLRVDQIDFDHEYWREQIAAIAEAVTFKPSASDEDRQAVRQRLEALVPELGFSSEGFGPGSAQHGEIDGAAAEPGGAFGPGATEFVRVLESLVHRSTQAVRRWLDTLRYLGPLRTYPDRGWALTDQRDPHWVAGGGEAWEAIKQSSEVREQVNQFLKSAGYAFAERTYLEREAAEDAVESHIEEVLGALATGPENGGIESPTDRPVDLLRSEAERLTDVVIVDGRNRIPVSPRDIGVGISQIVPVLALAHGLSEKTVLIEQPEIHLHPKMQADLGDVFLTAALKPDGPRNRFLIETHSEHLVLRLLRRIRQSTENDPAYPADLPRVRPEEVSVIYAEPTKEGTRLHHLRVTPDGDFADRWPQGFFTERGAELFT